MHERPIRGGHALPIQSHPWSSCLRYLQAISLYHITAILSGAYHYQYVQYLDSVLHRLGGPERPSSSDVRRRRERHDRERGTVHILVGVLMKGAILENIDCYE